MKPDNENRDALQTASPSRRRMIAGAAVGLAAPRLWGCDGRANGFARPPYQASRVPDALPSYVGPVATRTRSPMATLADVRQVMSRTFHYARDDLVGVQVILGNWFADVAGADGAEVGTGAPAMIRAAVEYPEGHITPLTFAGAETGVAPDGSQLLSDRGAVVIPVGARFWIRWWGDFPGRRGVPVNPVTPTYAPGGDGFEFGPSCRDRSHSVEPVRQQAATLACGPLAILGETRRPSFWLGADSRCYGQGDIGDLAGDTGELARSLGCGYAYINAGIPAQRMANLVDSSRSANQRALMALGSHGIIQAGINDLAMGHHSGRRLLEHLQTFITVWGEARPLYACTLSPLSRSTEGWKTRDGQSPAPGYGEIQLYNDALRAGISGLAGVIDLAAETSDPGGVWRALPEGALTADGIHPNPRGYAVIAASRRVNEAIGQAGEGDE